MENIGNSHAKMFDLDPPKHSSRSLWIAAALGAVAIHAGGIVLALASMPQDDPADVGARAIEISIELAAPHLEQSERPVGPDSEAAALAQERTELASDPVGEGSELTDIYVHRGLDRGLAKQVAEQLMAHDALAAHARDELGFSPRTLALIAITLSPRIML